MAWGAGSRYDGPQNGPNYPDFGSICLIIGTICAFHPPAAFGALRDSKARKSRACGGGLVVSAAGEQGRRGCEEQTGLGVLLTARSQRKRKRKRKAKECEA